MILFASSLLSNTLKLFGLVLLFVIIIIACYLVTKFIGTRAMGSMKTGNIRLIESFRLSQNQSVLIIKVGKKYFLFSSSKDSLREVTELQEDDFDHILESKGTNHPGNIKFSDLLSGFSKRGSIETKSKDK